jgi:hypothetical protein
MTVKQLENLVLAGVVVVVRKQDERVELSLGTIGTGRTGGIVNPCSRHPLPNPCLSAYRSAPPALREAMRDADAERTGAGRSRLLGGAFGSLTRSASRPFAGWQRVSRQQPDQTTRQTLRGKGTTRARTRTGHRTGNASVSG